LNKFLYFFFFQELIHSLGFFHHRYGYLRFFWLLRLLLDYFRLSFIFFDFYDFSRNFSFNCDFNFLFNSYLLGRHVLPAVFTLGGHDLLA